MDVRRSTTMHLDDDGTWERICAGLHALCLSSLTQNGKCIAVPYLTAETSGKLHENITSAGPATTVLLRAENEGCMKCCSARARSSAIMIRTHDQMASMMFFSTCFAVVLN